VKKIIHFSLADTKSGITQYVLNNWEYIDKSRYQFDVVTFGGKLEFQELLEAEGCRVFYVRYRAEEQPDEFRKEILQILKNRYDAVHLHTSYWKSFELEKLARQAGVPKIIVHSHNTGVFDDIGRNAKEEQHYKLRSELTPDIATDYWACSELAARWLYADKIIPEKIQILKNAVNIDRFIYNRAVRTAYRTRLRWDDSFIIGHVGRFSYQKNHEFLIKVFCKLTQIHEEVRLLLIGKGVLEKQIRTMAEEYGLSDKVYFTGACDDVNCWFQAMDLFCLPSRFEGFPIVAVEAQAGGVPSILSSTITQEAKIVENVTFIPLCEDEWINKIEEEIERDLSRNVQERMMASQMLKQQGYDLKDSVKELERLYEDTAN